MADLSTNISGVGLKNCIMNVGGVRTANYEELANIATSTSGGIVTSTMTPEPRSEAPEPNYYRFDLGSLASRTLPNPGYRKYMQNLSELKIFGKPVIASVAGADVKEFAEVAAYAAENGADLIELNTLCNGRSDGRLIGYNIRYDLPMMELLVANARRATKKPMGIKIPICSDEKNLERFADLVIKEGLQFITCDAPANIAMLVDIEKEQPVLSGNGLGNLAGPAMKPHTLASVRILHLYLKGRAAVIGHGGVMSGADAFQYLLAGANAVQIGTALRDEGVSAFSRISDELRGIMLSKGYKSVGEVVGKMKLLKS